MPVLLITFASYAQDAKPTELDIPPCMLGTDYEDPNLYVSDEDISKAVKSHPPLDSQYNFFRSFDIARKNGAPEDLVYELVSNITAFYKVKKEPISVESNQKAQAYGMQMHWILEELEATHYIPKRQ